MRLKGHCILSRIELDDHINCTDVFYATVQHWGNSFWHHFSYAAFQVTTIVYVYGQDVVYGAIWLKIQPNYNRVQCNAWILEVFKLPRPTWITLRTPNNTIRADWTEPFPPYAFLIYYQFLSEFIHKPGVVGSVTAVNTHSGEGHQNRTQLAFWKNAGRRKGLAQLDTWDSSFKGTCQA